MNKPGSVVQMSHASLILEPIMNWTRSDDEVLEQKDKKKADDQVSDDQKKEEEKLDKERQKELLALKMDCLRKKLE